MTKTFWAVMALSVALIAVGRGVGQQYAPQGPGAVETPALLQQGYDDPGYDGQLPGFGGPASPSWDWGNLWSQYHDANERIWISAEYLTWRTRGQEVPVLASQSPIGTAANVAGVLPGAAVLFGADRIDDDYRDGGRFRMGLWTVDGQFKGYELEYFGFGTERTHFGAESTSAGPLLARPFFNVDTAAEDANLLSGPALLLPNGFTYDVDGRLDIDTTMDLHSAGVIRRHVWFVNFENNFRLDWLLGYRYLKLQDSVKITDVVTLRNPSGGVIPSGTQIMRNDIFDATNDFHGGEIGLIAEAHRGRWSVVGVGKLALGNIREVTFVQGNTSQALPGQAFVPAPNTGGFLAQLDRGGAQFNIAQQTDDEFALIPQAELRVAFQMTDHWSATVGADFLHINHVVRSGEQIDRRVNPAFASLPDPVAPQRKFAESYFWAYGFNAGIECRY